MSELKKIIRASGKLLSQERCCLRLYYRAAAQSL